MTLDNFSQKQKEEKTKKVTDVGMAIPSGIFKFP